MPSSLETPVLQVDTNVIHKVDTSNPQNLFSMWTVFARCADSVAEGRRLENLSWRLWTRETICYEGFEDLASPAALSRPKPIHSPSRSSTMDEVPLLSGSVDSALDDEAVDFSPESSSLDIARPHIFRQDSCASNRSKGRERHISSGDLEKMVVTILHAKEPLNAPLPDIAACYSPKQQPSTPPMSSVLERSGSTSTESPCKTSESSIDSLTHSSSPGISSKTKVIHGFSPSQASISRLSHMSKAKMPTVLPEPEAEPAAKIVQSKKQPLFLVGASSCESYSDRAQSVETQQLQPIVQSKKKMFQVGASPDEDGSLKSALHVPRPNSLLTAQKKQASFSKEVVTRTIPAASASAIESDSEYEYDESAIESDDEDEDDWEDSTEEKSDAPAPPLIEFKRIDSKVFQRPDSQVKLPSRPSLISLMVAKNERSHQLSNAASHSTSALHRSRTAPLGVPLVASPNDSDESPLMMKRATRAPPMRPNDIPRSTAQPIVNTASGIHHQAALSPRTTRRNMLATELTESLRRHLLWERSQKTSTANAVLRRRHTSHDVANLKQYPEKPYMKPAEEANTSNADQVFSREAFGGYHVQGW